MFASFPQLIAGYHVFRRLSMPRHSPCTLSSLTTFIDHRHGSSPEPRMYMRGSENAPPSGGWDARPAHASDNGSSIAKKVLDDPCLHRDSRGDNKFPGQLTASARIAKSISSTLNLAIHLSKSTRNSGLTPVATPRRTRVREPSSATMRSFEFGGRQSLLRPLRSNI